MSHFGKSKGTSAWLIHAISFDPIYHHAPIESKYQWDYRIIVHLRIIQFPTLRLFVEAFKDNECTFRRALVQLEGDNMISKPIPSFPMSDQTTAAHLIVIFERCGEIKEVIETYENESYMLQVGRIRDLISSLVADLGRLDGPASKIASVDVMRRWSNSIESMESRATIDSQKLSKDLSALKQSLLTIAHAYRV